MPGGGADRLIYLYDEANAPIGLQYRDPSMAEGAFYTFWFEKNLQGDIVAIYRENGTRIGTYKYDAWGACTCSYTTGTTYLERVIVTSYNPFRYRGYYFDEETGFYYLNSRYYNPQWGRFISADGYISTGSGILGYNMFAYCNNNPVMRVDPTGEAWWIVAIAALAIIAVSLKGCYGPNSTSQIVPEKEEDNSWINDFPSLKKGRYEQEEDAINAALDKVTESAKNSKVEQGCFVFELYGGYYVSSFNNYVYATDRSIKLDPSSLPKGSKKLLIFILICLITRVSYISKLNWIPSEKMAILHTLQIAMAGHMRFFQMRPIIWIIKLFALGGNHNELEKNCLRPSAVCSCGNRFFKLHFFSKNLRSFGRLSRIGAS